MKILFHNLYENINQNNNLFESPNVDVGDNLLKPFNLLGIEAIKHNLIVGTHDKVSIEEADVFVFIDYPREDDRVFKYALLHKKPMFLISFESPIISNAIFNTNLHIPFLKVFTWADKLVKLYPEKYIKINYSFDIKPEFSIAEKRLKDFVIISGNKSNFSKNELYSTRFKCIKWFDKNHHEHLDLFGFGWGLRSFYGNFYIGRVANFLNEKYSILKIKSLKVYKGSITRKYDVLKNYNFSIALENVFGHDGYITEKIIDCLLSGTIPIYKGAPNITEYIPANCFINFDDFNSYKSMYDSLTNMSQDTIINYRKNIYSFLTSSKADSFRASHFVDTLISTLISIK
jgi:hypothetical protein